MFCPKCGTAEQSAETFCRKCGQFLPNFDKVKKEIPAEQHIEVNSFFSAATAVIGLSLAITLNLMFLGREGTPWIIYVVFAFLMMTTVWHVQTFIRTRMLKKQFEKLRPRSEDGSVQPALAPKEPANLLEEANFESAVPASVAERTTRNLTPRSSQSKQ